MLSSVINLRYFCHFCSVYRVHSNIAHTTRVRRQARQQGLARERRVAKEINAKICKFLFARQFQFNDSNDDGDSPRAFSINVPGLFFPLLLCFQPGELLSLVPLTPLCSHFTSPLPPSLLPAQRNRASPQLEGGRKGGKGEWIFEKWKSVRKLAH